MDTVPIMEVIRKRHSVRTYQEKMLTDEDNNKLKDYIEQLHNPFGVKVSIYIINKSTDRKGEKLGTYGIIKGAKTFLGVSVPKVKNSFIAAGYVFEDLILYATSLGLGTVWLAATFSRTAFAAAMNIKEDESFPAISPVGYPAEKRTIKESIMRKAMNSENRKSWSELFYEGTFYSPLKEEKTGEYKKCLDMVRLAPSSKNQQPWRIVKKDSNYHFFVECNKNLSIEEKSIKLVDIGIALFHFHKTAEQTGIKGCFEEMDKLDINIPENIEYVISWKDYSI